MAEKNDPKVVTVGSRSVALAQRAILRCAMFIEEIYRSHEDLVSIGHFQSIVRLMLPISSGVISHANGCPASAPMVDVGQCP